MKIGIVILACAIFLCYTAHGDDAVKTPLELLSSFERELPKPTDWKTRRGLSWVAPDGKIHPIAHLNSLASQLGVNSLASARSIRAKLSVEDAKIRYIAGFAIWRFAVASGSEFKGRPSSAFRNTEDPVFMGFMDEIRRFLDRDNL